MKLVVCFTYIFKHIYQAAFSAHGPKGFVVTEINYLAHIYHQVKPLGRQGPYSVNVIHCLHTVNPGDPYPRYVPPHPSPGPYTGQYSPCLHRCGYHGNGVRVSRLGSHDLDPAVGAGWDQP